MGYLRVGNRRYTNPDYSWSIEYPEAWTIDSDDSAFVKISGPARAPRREQGLVGIRSRTFDQSLDEFAETWLASQRFAARGRGQRFEMAARRDTVRVDDVPMVEIWTRLGTGVVGRSWAMLIVAAGRAVVVNAETYQAAWNAREPEFERIMTSFRP